MVFNPFEFSFIHGVHVCINTVTHYPLQPEPKSKGFTEARIGEDTGWTQRGDKMTPRCPGEKSTFL